ncbi:hypothetical protein [uncultured Parabacteroides sp.]|uniref:hypothetical protein n=1 Tax=uncultured Parabacteroides sp. TaxID=512312 RepID=UPI00265A188C|nr:hypothetical protein [uncultured Parabacteroides sp.]
MSSKNDILSAIRRHTGKRYEMPRFMIYNFLNAWGKGRELPTFAKQSFNEMWKSNKIK